MARERSEAAHARDGKVEGSGWTRGKGSGPGSYWARGERKEEELGWVAFEVWAGWGFLFLFLFPLSSLFLIQTKFEFKYKFEFKPHSNN